MPLPSGLQSVTVNGQYTNPDGTARQGTVTFTPAPGVVSSASQGSIVLGPVTARPNPTNGQFTVQLLATDATGVTPTGWTYTVVETWTDTTSSRTYNISLPAASSPVNLGALTPTGPAVGTGNVASVGGVAVSGTAASGRALTATSGTAATWQGTPGPVYNVLSYGADPTGTTDSTAALQAAINAAQASAGIVYLPPGAYTAFGIPQITGSGIVVRGAGSATTIKLASAAQNASGTSIGLWVNGGSNITIEELAFDGNFANIAKDGGVVVASSLFGSSALGAAVNTAPAQGTTETWTVNAAASTATAGYSGLPLVFKVDSEQVLLTGGQGTTSWTVRRGFSNSTPATHTNGAAISNTEGLLFDATITKYGTNSPKVYKSSTYAGGVDASTYLHQRMPIRITNAENVTVRGCLIQNSVSAGILADSTSVGGCTDILVTGNRVKLTWDNAVYFHQGVQYAEATANQLSDTMYNGVSAVYSDRVLITGNTIRAAGPSFSDSGGVQINGSSNCAVSSNMITGCQFYGVDVLSSQETNITGGAGGNQVWSSNTSITNNSITGCHANDYSTHTAPGVNLFGSAGTIIAGNVIDACDYGISMGSKATHTDVLSNRITNCLSLGVNVGNSADVVDTIIKGNIIAGCGSHGVYANAPVRVENCTITGNTGMGVNLSSPPSGVPQKTDWITGCTILDNTDSGVYANAGTGNIAVVERNQFGNSQSVFFADASITFGSATLTSATAAFTSADIGLPVVVMNQGGGGGTTATTITAVTNATTITMGATAQGTETGVAFWIGRGPALYVDGATTNAANSVLTSATAAFTASDAGKLIVLMSQALTPTVLFTGTIQSVTNATTAVLSGAAGAISACTFTINRSAGQQVRGINNGSGTVVERNNTTWGIPEILTGGNTYNLQVTDRTVVANSQDYNVKITDRFIAITALTAGIAVILPDPTTMINIVVTVKDESGQAALNTITVKPANGAQHIDGSGTLQINQNYGVGSYYSNGVQWFTVN